MADNNADDLDQLLDSALDDFSTLNLSSRDGSGGGGAGPSSSAAAVKGLGLGLGSGLPELGTGKRKGKQGAAAAAPTPPNESHASAALKELRRQTRETVRGLESATAVAAVPPPRGGLGFENEGIEDLLKQFEELAGSQDMESVVETMMQQLLSKEILHEPMKEIGEKYPKWLEEHKSELKPEECDRYSRQCQLILQLNDVYENEPDNFQKIMDLMQKMQECGQPPSDIVQDLAPDLDLASLGGQISPEMLGSSPNCCIM